MADSEQRKVFAKPADRVRKLALATSVAEASITIDGVRHVIDFGRVKVMPNIHAHTADDADAVRTPR